MPMQWTPENQAKLLALVFEKCDVNVSSAIKEEIAKEMGPECTAKAITHQIAKLRGPVKKTAADATPKKRPSPAKKSASKSKKAKQESADNDSDADETSATRVKAESADEDDDDDE